MNFFQEDLSLFLSDTIKASQVDRKMKRAEVLRHTQTAESLWRKVITIVAHITRVASCIQSTTPPLLIFVILST